MVESWNGFHLLLSTSGTFGRPLGDFHRVFRHCRKWCSYSAKISRHLQILYSGDWQVWVCKQDSLKWLEIKPTTAFPVNRGLFSLVFGGQEKKRSLFLPPASTREKRPLLAGKPHLRHTCKKTQQIPMPRGVTARKGTGMLVRKWPRLYLTPKTGKQTRAS